MSLCSIRASLKRMAKSGGRDDEIKKYKNLLKSIEKVKHWKDLKLCKTAKKCFNRRKGTCA